MQLPSIETYGRGSNAHAVVIPFPSGDVLKVWYSYKTPVAFAFNGKRTVRENQWGNTTAQHLAAIDGGDKLAKKARVSGELFEVALHNALASPLAQFGADAVRVIGERGGMGTVERNLGRLSDGLARDGFRELGRIAHAANLLPAAEVQS